MTRKEAIEHIYYIMGLAESEYSYPSDEPDVWDREMREALTTLGVTAEEIDGAFSPAIVEGKR